MEEENFSQKSDVTNFFELDPTEVEVLSLGLYRIFFHFYNVIT